MHKSVWIVEDDSDDRYLTQEILSELGIHVPVKFLSSSDEVFQSLSSSEPPSLILIDYNLTPDNGLEVLKKLKSDDSFKKIPVVILSDSDHPKYKEECYRHGASSFIKKPDSLDGTQQKIGTFFKYWMEVAEV
jgi:CheY-like chemotaxis protein